MIDLIRKEDLFYKFRSKFLKNNLQGIGKTALYRSYNSKQSRAPMWLCLYLIHQLSKMCIFHIQGAQII